MGKKTKNKKLKRILRAQALASNAQTESVTVLATDENGEIKSTPAVTKQEAEVIQVSEDKKEVRHEIKKILITIAVLVLIIVAVDLVNSRTDIILKIGQFFADKLNLNL